MSTRYAMHDPQSMYFLTSTIIGWVDLFSRKYYRDIMLESFSFCREQKGLQLHGYVIMTNHVHFIASAKDGFALDDIVRDIKKFTSKQFTQAIQFIDESRREWMLGIFKSAGLRNSNNKTHQVWKQDNHPVIIRNEKVFQQKLDYIHQNPVRACVVARAEDYLYSSAKNYCGEKGLIEVDVIFVHQ